MPNTHFTPRLEKIKRVFQQSAKSIPYHALGEEGELNELAGNTQDRLAIIETGLVEQLIRMNSISVDQVSNCFEIMKYMQFFGKAVLANEEYFSAERGINGVLMNAFCEMMAVDSADCKKLVVKSNDTIKGLEDIDPAVLEDIRKNRDMWREQFARIDEIAESFDCFKERAKKGLPLFDADQKPVLDWKTPQIAFALLQNEGLDNIDRLITQTVDFATKMLVKMQLIQNRIIPENTDLTDKWLHVMRSDRAYAGRLIDRADSLAEMHAQRVRFVALEMT